jgi:hypothetical protein
MRLFFPASHNTNSNTHARTRAPNIRALFVCKQQQNKKHLCVYAIGQARFLITLGNSCNGGTQETCEAAPLCVWSTIEADSSAAYVFLRNETALCQPREDVGLLALLAFPLELEQSTVDAVVERALRCAALNASTNNCQDFFVNWWSNPNLMESDTWPCKENNGRCELEDVLTLSVMAAGYEGGDAAVVNEWLASGFCKKVPENDADTCLINNRCKFVNDSPDAQPGIGQCEYNNSYADATTTTTTTEGV